MFLLTQVHGFLSFVILLSMGQGGEFRCVMWKYEEMAGSTGFLDTLRTMALLIHVYPQHEAMVHAQAIFFM